MTGAGAVSIRAPASGPRIASIDWIRGAVMILMAIDHVRVYAGVPAGGPMPAIFFTRWITHFCAPAFIFLAGTSAYFHGRSHAGLPRFLLVRGAWLVLIELTYLRLAWTFNLDWAHYLLAGVIWAIGWCMILMSGLVRLPVAAIGAFALALIGGHNLLDPHIEALSEGLGNDLPSALWKILYVGFWAGPVQLGPAGPSLTVLYSIVPWIGVMAAGYAFAGVLAMEPARRDRACVTIGLVAIALFLVLRGFNLYGDPRPWRAPSGPDAPKGPLPALMAFLNTTKYPASLDFLLMTLGPMITAIPWIERARGPAAGFVSLFGRVPFFYYMLHIPLIHALALVVSWIRQGSVSPWLFENHPMGNPPPPEGYTWSLPLLYLTWMVAIALLYPACRWFAALKARRAYPWLSYL